jgi:hypothetical protein
MMLDFSVSPPICVKGNPHVSRRVRWQLDEFIAGYLPGGIRGRAGCERQLRS